MIINKNITENIKQLLIEARNKVVKSVNLAMDNNKRKNWGIKLLTPMQKYEKLLEKQLVCL